MNKLISWYHLPPSPFPADIAISV